MSEIDDPIPREHTTCIVRAGLLIKRIMKLREAQTLLDLEGVEQAVSTVMGSVSESRRVQGHSHVRILCDHVRGHIDRR